MSSLVSFAAVGAAGTVTNLAIFYLLVEALGLSPLVGSTGAFFVAVTQNYAANRAWTFRSSPRQTWLRGWTRYVIGSALGFGLSLLVLLWAVWIGLLPILAQAAGILIGLVANFLLSRFLVFPDKSPPADSP